MFYKVFKRSCSDWKSYRPSRKITVTTGLTLQEAQQMCKEYNNNRTQRQINRGTKMEFTEQ
jgi:hypothetical protein